jgi:hypothetical protein
MCKAHWILLKGKVKTKINHKFKVGIELFNFIIQCLILYILITLRSQIYLIYTNFNFFFIYCYMDINEIFVIFAKIKCKNFFYRY